MMSEGKTTSEISFRVKLYPNYLLSFDQNIFSGENEFKFIFMSRFDFGCGMRTWKIIELYKFFFKHTIECWKLKFEICETSMGCRIIIIII
jgi:hypothetical protein